MSTTLANFNAGLQQINALNTYDYTVGSTATHVVSVQATGLKDTSALKIEIFNGASSKGSITAANGQEELNLTLSLPCNVNDVLHIALTSAQSVDNQLNPFQAVARINVGSSN